MIITSTICWLLAVVVVVPVCCSDVSLALALALAALLAFYSWEEGREWKCKWGRNWRGGRGLSCVCVCLRIARHCNDDDDSESAQLSSSIGRAEYFALLFAFFFSFFSFFSLAIHSSARPGAQYCQELWMVKWHSSSSGGNNLNMKIPSLFILNGNEHQHQQ